MAIELELSVADKGSAQVERATANWSASFRRAEMAASSLGSEFSSIGNHILNITGRLFSFNTLIGTLAGGTGVGLLTKKLIELGQATGDAGFEASVSGLGSAWGDFTGKIGKFISESPAVRQGLSDLSEKVSDWGKALMNNKDVIESWASYAASAVSGVGDLITKTIEGMANLAREAPIANMTQDQVSERLRMGLLGEFPEGYLQGSSSGGGADIGSIIGAMQRGATISGGGTTVYITEKQSRSDVLSIAAELQRESERNSGNSSGPFYQGSIY